MPGDRRGRLADSVRPPKPKRLRFTGSFGRACRAGGRSGAISQEADKGRKTLGGLAMYQPKGEPRPHGAVWRAKWPSKTWGVPPLRTGGSASYPAIRSDLAPFLTK